MLTQTQIIVHVLYAVLATACIMVYSQPRNNYVGVRMTLAVYVMCMVTNLAHAHYDRGRSTLIAFAVFFALNQWGTWALIHQYDDNTTVLATYIARVTVGWLVSLVVAKFILPVATTP